MSNSCQRCGIGVDDDFDGDCAVCASASNRLMAEFNRLRADNICYKRELTGVVETRLKLTNINKHLENLAVALDEGEVTITSSAVRGLKVKGYE